MKMRILLAGTATLLTFGGAAMAQEDTGSMTITASVAAQCFFGTIDALDLGAYTQTAHAEDSTTLQATCTQGTDYTIAFDDGNNAADGARRLLSGTSDFLSYQIFRDSGREDAIGLVGGTNTLTSTGTGTAQTFTVYGRIPSGQPLVIGTYGDTIGLTITIDADG